MTELRQKMIRAMELKNLSPHTRRAYLAAVTGLSKHYRQSPAAITKEMIEDYLLSLDGPQPAVQHPDLFACQPRNARQGPQPAGWLAPVI